MNKADWRQLVEEIHDNAVNHGWWETERPVDETYAMIHSEVSEALDEYRNGRPDVYEVSGKPEGVWVELIDVVIRICDYAVKRKCNPILINNPDGIMRKEVSTRGLTCTMTKLVMVLHKYITLAYMAHTINDTTNEDTDLLIVVSAIFNYISARGGDPVKLMRQKHAYNLTREYRHGGKMC